MANFAKMLMARTVLVLLRNTFPHTCTGPHPITYLRISLQTATWSLLLAVSEGGLTPQLCVHVIREHECSGECCCQ